jgi:hypothetical protein
MVTPRLSRRVTSPTLAVAALALFAAIASPALAQKKRLPPGGNIAVIADERLAALRVAPTLISRLIRRLSRGRFVSVRATKRNHEGVYFSQVVVTRRTSGWIQSEALIMAGRNGDDERLAHLIGGTDEFERIARARVFLDNFPRSALRPKVLLALGDAAEEAAAQLTREATRRFDRREVPTDGAPEFSYYLNLGTAGRSL